MRIGTFLLGGIVGAMAVTYINKNNGNMMANWTSAGQSVGDMVSKAKSRINMNSNMSSHNDNRNQYQTEKSNQPADMSRVKEILNKDPELKSKVDGILADNNETASASRMQ